MKIDIETFQSHIAKNSSIYKGWPLINIASLLGETTIVRQLIHQGALVNASDANGNSALHQAASQGQLKVVKLLIKTGININALNHKHQTPLFIAASSGQLKTINYLIKKGANTSIIANNKSSPLSIAISKKHIHSARVLASKKLDKASIHQALLLSIQHRLDHISVSLIKRDKLLLFTDSNNRSALWHSANTGLIEATRELVNSHKIDIDLSDNAGYTALARAVNNGHKAITDLLLKQDASITPLTEEHNSILMLSVLSQQAEIFNAILNVDKNINAKNKVGNTALMLAARSGNINFVKQLIIAGADIQTRNQEDLNAFQIAKNSGHEATAKFIKENSGKLFQLFN